MIGKRRCQVVLNGEHPTGAQGAAVAHALQDPAILTEKGGYIFKAALMEECLHLALCPTVIGAIRQMHHTMVLEVASPLIADGFINADGSLAVVLLKPGAAPLLQAGDRPAAEALLRCLGQTLLGWGLAPQVPLDFITRLTVEECGLLPACPASLGELVAAFEDESS